MSDNIVLGSATQQNLLSLQNINSELSTTQNHLATGLKVASAADDAVVFFQAQSLTNRASDLTTRKSNIDQGISSLSTATQGIQSAISILQQMQGLLQSAKTETATERASAASQFNTLSVQLNQLLNDSSYQGLNLINSTTSNLTLQFSDATASRIKISGQNLLMSVMMSKQHVGITTYTGFSKGGGHSAGGTFSHFFSASGTNPTGHTAGSGHSSGSTFSTGTKTLSGQSIKLSKISTYKMLKWTGATTSGSGHSTGSGFSKYTLVDYSKNAAGSGHSVGSGASIYQLLSAGAKTSAGTSHSAGSGFSKIQTQLGGVKASLQATAFAHVKFSTAVSTNKTSAFDTVYNALNNAISVAQAAAASLGSNVSLLNTRSSFTASYITTLQGGANSLTVADVNLESTNLVTLQTRQQLAIQSLSIATSSERAVLSLFH